jgi:hypothetical protein
MKNAIKFYVVIFLALGLCSCKSFFDDEIFKPGKYLIKWMVINDTDENIYYKFSNDDRIEPILLLPMDDSVLLFIDEREFGDDDFSMLEEAFNYSYLSVDFLLYLDYTAAPIKTWTLKDKDASDKQFYKESSWEEQISEDGFLKTFTFRIEQSDIE